MRKGSIPLQSIRDVVENDKGREPFCFNIDTEERVYFLRADSLPEMNDWMR